jgi:hypothetical protein
LIKKEKNKNKNKKNNSIGLPQGEAYSNGGRLQGQTHERSPLSSLALEYPDHKSPAFSGKKHFSWENKTYPGD